MHRKALRGLRHTVHGGHCRAICAVASTKDMYDVAVVGAGLTGAALAAGLGRRLT